jgi:Condensation domain
LKSDRAKPFDLADRQSPLFRATVFVRSESEFNWVFSCHHAILDGWGHRVLINELVQAYLAIRAGRKVETRAPNRTYREFVAYQEAVRKSESAREFWQQYLRDVGPVSVPRSAPLDCINKEEGKAVHPLEPAMVEALSRVCRGRAVSMQALMLAAWMESLRLLTGHEMVTTGVVMNGRTEYLSDPLSAIGLFWNVMPVVSRAALPLLEQASAIHQDLIDIGPYAAYPLPQLIQYHAAKELFFCSFRYLNFWNQQQLPAESGLRLLGMHASDRYSFPLACTASVNPMTGGGTLQLEYDPEVFAASTIQSVLDHFASLLRNVSIQP